MKNSITILATLVITILLIGCASIKETNNTFSANGELFSELKLDSTFVKTKGAIKNTPFSDICGNIPENMGDLTGGIKKYFYKFSAKSSANLDAFGYGGGSLENKETLLIVDFVQHKDVFCTDGKKRTFGVGARLFLKISKKKRSVSFGLPKLAANVELGKAEVEYTISTIGLTGDKILDALPTGNEFDVENYAKIVNSIDSIIRLAKDSTDGVNIDPQLLPSN